ncbi:MAG TPA: alginate lyase family protein [Vicinamibacterales bacterium]
MDNAPPFPFEPSIQPPLAAAEASPAAAGFERRDRGGLRRLRDMRFAEIAYRGWQEASKWLERVTPTEQFDHPEALLRRHAPDLADPDAALRVVREAAPARFFAGVQDAAVAAALRERLPGYRQEVIAEADALLEHHFDLLGYRTLWFGDPVDWHLDPIRSRRSPLVPWSRLDPFDAEVVGDARIVWELNRHQWLVRLALARVLTGDERYAGACVHAIDEWLGTNPPGAGLNWASSLEASFRTVSWCWVLLLLRDSAAVSAEWTTKVLASLWVHAAHIRRYLSHYSSPTTQLTGEALGLFYVATLFPEFRDAARWRELSVSILVAESDAQIRRDGVHFEQSTCYQRYAVETYLHFLLLAARNGVHVPKQVAERVRQMVEFLLVIRQPNTSIPLIGDGDGGTLLPLVRRSSGDGRGIFGVAATLFERADFAWAADGPAPEIFWLLGAEGINRVDRMPSAPPGSDASRVFPSGGYAVMRTDWEADAHQIIVDVGPLGCPVSGGHGHADLLSIQCTIFGEPCLVDAGTYCCTGEPQWRDFFRSTAAHSTVVVDGQSQAEPAGPFGWRRQPRGRLREWHSTPEFDFLDAEHDGYLTLPDPVVHRRRVIFVKPGFWIVVDDLSGATRHQVDLTFQFAPIAVTLGAHPWARAETPKGRVLWVSPFPSAPVQPALHYGGLAPIRGWISRDYGQRQPAPMLIYSFAVALPWRIVTLLLPDRQGAASPPRVRAIYDEAGRPAGVAFDRPRRTVRFDDEAVCVERE